MAQGGLVARRLIPIAVIFCGASLAWLILDSTLVSRTAESDESQTSSLSSQWGSPQTQAAPSITARGTKMLVPFSGSRINVRLDLVQRRKGLLWYNLYDVDFAGHYVVRNDTANPHLTAYFPLPSTAASYANLYYRIGGRPVDATAAIDRGRINFDLAPGAQTTVEIGYASRGMESWIYQFSNGIASVRNLSLTMTTDFKAIDFPAQTLLPVREDHSGSGWRLEWKYKTLVTGDGIGMQVPYPMQPGPLAQRITLWAPVALLFYFFVMLLITTIRNIDLHPINYYFLAAAFFSFHLLFAYLVDRIPVDVAFSICSVVSMFLTISYLRLVVGWRFAAVESGFAQLTYLVLFSLALFNEGWSGLTITVGAIVSLFVAMQATGRIRWSERFAQTF